MQTPSYPKASLLDSMCPPGALSAEPEFPMFPKAPLGTVGVGYCSVRQAFTGSTLNLMAGGPGKELPHDPRSRLASDGDPSCCCARVLGSQAASLTIPPASTPGRLQAVVRAWGCWSGPGGVGLGLGVLVGAWGVAVGSRCLPPVGYFGRPCRKGTDFF